MIAKRVRCLRSAAGSMALIACASLASPCSANPQHSDFQVWPTLAITATSGKLEFTGDAIFGLTDNANRQGELLLRGIVSYLFSDAVSVGTGYTYFTINDGVGAQLDEHRVVQEIKFRSAPSDNRPMLLLRSRLEERLKENSNGVSLRFRQMARIDVPLKYGLKAIARNETFYLLNRSSWAGQSGFSTMFNFVGLGIPLSRHFSLEPGYLNQTNFRPGRNSVRHTLQTTLAVRL